jgi:hypothetical protein
MKFLAALLLITALIGGPWALIDMSAASIVILWIVSVLAAVSLFSFLLERK